MNRTALTIGIALALLPPAGARAGEKLVPLRHDGRLLLFDATRHDQSVIRNMDYRPEKGNDLIPVCRQVTSGGRSVVEYSFRGKRGMARSVFYVSQVPPAPDGRAYQGLAVTAGYDKGDYARLGVTAAFSDKTLVSFKLTLEKGVKTYSLTSGYRRAKFPPKWELLTWLRITAQADGKGNDTAFRLHSIALLEGERKETGRVLRVERVRKVHEVLPVVGAVKMDGTLDDETWRGREGLPSFSYYRGSDVTSADSPLAVKLAYDREKLYIASQSEFPTPPLARFTQQDSRVWQDDAYDIVFHSRNERTVLIKFAVNAAGAVADSFDGDTGQNATHEKAMSYDNGRWTAELAFPLYELNVDLDRQRRMGFQIAQWYQDRKAPRLRTLSWTQTNRFADVGKLGVLVFNQKPFGPGQIGFERIARLGQEGDKADFSFVCSLKGFEPGTYRVKLDIPDATQQPRDVSLEIPQSGAARRTFSVFGAENRNSLYTLYVTVINSRNDAKVFAVSFRNETEPGDMFGERVFLPKPKQVKWRKGELPLRECDTLWLPTDATSRTKRTAELFAEKLHGFAGIRVATTSFSGPLPPKGIVLRLADSVTFDGKREPARSEGYALSVEPARAVITGFDEPGLYYGTVTFVQLIKQPMRVTKQMPVPCVDILDWPDLPRRLSRLEHPHTLGKQAVKENRGIEFLMEWTERFVAENKLNVLMVDLSATVQYKRRPEFTGGGKIYSLEDLERYGEFCRDRFVDLCPAWQIGGHGTWWLYGFHSDMREKGWRSQYDITHPDHDAIMFDCMLDVIEALKPKYLSPKSDEWWHSRKPGETPDELLRGKTRAQAFLDLHLRLHRWLKERGVTMAMYHDMLIPYHNGTRYDVHKIIDSLPNEIVMLVWSVRHPKMISYFTDRGFPVWVNPTGMFLVGDADKPRIQGYGKGLYSFGNNKWSLVTPPKSTGSMAAHFHACDYAWNMNLDDGTGTQALVESGYLPAIRHMFAVKPNPFADERVEPLDIAAHMTHSFDAFVREVKPKDYADGKAAVELPAGTHEIGFMPMQLTGDREKDCIVLREKSPEVVLPVGKRFSSLVFLHTAFINNPGDKRVLDVKRRQWPYGQPVGDYVVRYADGKEVTLPIRLTMNIRRLGTDALHRATLDNRCVFAMKDANQNDVNLFQWEWINPRPQQDIDRIVVRHSNQLDVSLILMAVSGRHVREPSSSR